MTSMTSMTSETSREHVTDTLLVIKGLYGRNRTAKFQVLTLARRPQGTPSDTREVIRLAETKLAEVKFRSGYVAIEERDVEVRTHADGARINVFMPMQDRMIHCENADGPRLTQKA